MLRFIKYHLNYRPQEGYMWDWHRWLHLRWWRIWLTTTRCDGCKYSRIPYSLTEVFCVFCLQSSFGYPTWVQWEWNKV